MGLPRRLPSLTPSPPPALQDLYLDEAQKATEEYAVTRKRQKAEEVAQSKAPVAFKPRLRAGVVSRHLLHGDNPAAHLAELEKTFKVSDDASQVVAGFGTVARRALIAGETFVDPTAQYAHGPKLTDLGSEETIKYSEGHILLRGPAREEGGSSTTTCVLRKCAAALPTSTLDYRATTASLPVDDSPHIPL